MKKCETLLMVLLVAFAMLSGTGYAANDRLSEPARGMIAQAAPNEILPVVVLMKERPDVPALREMVRDLPREQKTQLVWETVRDLAERTQYDLLYLLDEDQRNGLVEEYTSICIINGISLKATAEVIERIAKRDDVGRIIADPLQQVFNPVESAQGGELDEIVWSVLMINAPEVWDMGYTGEGVLVAIIDSGVNYNHVDLADHVWDGGDEFPHHGWDFANNDNDPLDDYGHGTHVAGSICGDGTGGTQTGVAPDATLMICKVSLGTGQADQATVWEAHDFVLEHGAEVTSMSMGYLDSWNPDRTTWRGTYEVLDVAGIVNVVAAGNERGWYQPPIACRTPGDVPSPWRHPDEVEEGGRGGVISVGATTDQDVYASFSSNGPCEWEDVDPYYDYPYGNGHFGLIRPDIAAPGEDVYSTSMNGGYEYMSGTSMATPHIAGVVCLILSKTPELLPVQTDSVMQITALDLGPDGKDNDYGAGRVRADLAVEAANPPFGYLQGTVNDGNTGEALEGVEVTVVESGRTAVTDDEGWYFMNVFNGVHSIRVEHPPYLPFQEDGVEIAYDDTTTLDITLLAGILDFSTDTLSVTMVEDTVASQQFTVYNNGVGEADVELSIYPTLETDDFLDEVFSFNATEMTGDSRLNGAAYSDGVLYVSGSNMVYNPNYIYRFSESGEYLGSFIQPGSDQPDASSFGMRDLAVGGGLLWGSDNGDIIAMNTETGEEQRRFAGPYNPNRALAYDSDNDILWVGDVMSDLYALDPETGEEIGTIPSYYRINGLGYRSDDPDGFTLYMVIRSDTSNCSLFKINPETDEFAYVAELAPNDDMVYGLSFAEGFGTYYNLAVGIVDNPDGNGDQLVGWEFSVNVDWAEAEPMSFTVTPADSQIVTVSFLRGQRGNGLYHGFIQARHNTLVGENRIVLNMIIDEDAVAGGELVENLPVEFALENPYPNPFNSVMRINYTVPRREHVRIVVFDILGREVALLADNSIEPGRYSAVFNGEELSSGIYFVRLESTEYIRTVKAVLLK